VTAAGAPARYRHGLVIGKFYPPHRGHLYLIGAAARQCAAVTVLAMASRRETVPLADRVAWLRAACAGLPGVAVTGAVCDAPVDYGDPAVWTAQVAVMRAALERDGRPGPDAVFSSEPYGAELAARLGACPVAVDPGRARVPVSASAIRADLAGHWADLAGPARAGLATRVVVLGAESTGTTTVATGLAAAYAGRGGAFARTACVPEAGRDYTAMKWRQARAAAAAAGARAPALDELTWTAADFDAIAAEQTALEERGAASGSPLVVCDTDAFATSVWERRYLGAAARGPQPWATTGLPRRDVYLLTSHEGVPWCDDGLREGDLAVRAAMTGWFIAALTAAGHSWVLLAGSLAARLRLAARVTDAALADRACFGPAATDTVAP
jgi:HTH-type transcriptional regulator, transcriptional repressor of NAD biosynthesis genes